MLVLRVFVRVLHQLPLMALLLLLYDGEVDARLPSDSFFPNIPTPPASPESSTVWEEDEDWWEGAEEVDLTIPWNQLPEEDVEDYLVLEENETIMFFNETFFDDFECDDFLGSVSSPPNMEEVPPPPPPPFLVGMNDLLQESLSRWRQVGPVGPLLVTAGEEDPLLKTKLNWVSVDDDQKCSICDWANGGNETIDLLYRKPEASVRLSKAMVVILVGVALISATVGASVMGFLLKCKQVKSLPCGSGRSWFSSSGGGRVHSQSQGGLPPRGKTGLAMKLWRRGSSQAPLQPCSSPGSENSYSEEPYVNEGVGPPVVRLHPSPPNNTYVEIPPGDPPESTYENSGFLPSETDVNESSPNESSTGSASTPSSAYYSDVSANDVFTSKKKKKKRKGGEQRTPTYPIIGGNLTPSVICSHVSHQPVHLNLNAVQSHFIPTRDNSVPVSMQLMPRQIESRGPPDNAMSLIDPQTTIMNNKNLHQNPRLLQLNIRNYDGNIVPSHRNYDPNLGVPQRQICIPQHSSIPCVPPGGQQIESKNLNECHNEVSNGSVGLPNNIMEGQLRALNAPPEELMLRTYNGNVVQRPLPPLPSRQPVDPRRRNFKVSLGQNAQNIPSEV